LLQRLTHDGGEGEARGGHLDAGGDSPEVHCAHDADKLECLFQAVEYRDSGYQNVDGWIQSSRTKLHTTSAERLADAAVAMTSQEWHNTHEPDITGEG
jgi:putative hydrolase of HD superfamily